MFDLKNFFLWNNDFFNFKDSEISKNYHEWYIHTKQGHITAVSALSAILYILYYQVNRLVTSPELTSYMMIIELCLIPLFLFTISYLSAKQINNNFMTTLLILVPIGAALGNMLIISKMELPQTYLTEIYLLIIWIFIVSGLRFLHATLSAFTVLLLSLCTTYFIYPLAHDLFIMHFFWIFTAFTLGFFGAYLLEKLNKDIFLAYEELIVYSETDCSPVFQDKKHLEEIIEKELSRNQRYGHHFSLLFFEIDDFEDITNAHGHQVSDFILIEMAKFIKEQIRLSDTVLRLGAEIFVVVTQEADEHVAIKLAEKLRNAVALHNFKTVGKKTISIGVTSYKEHDDGQMMIDRAESTLKKSKIKGRNRIEFF